MLASTPMGSDQLNFMGGGRGGGVEFWGSIRFSTRIGTKTFLSFLMTQVKNISPSKKKNKTSIEHNGSQWRSAYAIQDKWGGGTLFPLQNNKWSLPY